MERIIVGIDESEHAAHALRWAVHEGRAHDAEVVALMAWGYLDQRRLDPDSGFDPNYDAEKADRVAHELVARALGDDADQVVVRAVNGLAATALLEAATECDLLVVGSRGLGGFRGLALGSVSSKVVAHAACPVVVLRGPES